MEDNKHVLDSNINDQKTKDANHLNFIKASLSWYFYIWPDYLYTLCFPGPRESKGPLELLPYLLEKGGKSSINFKSGLRIFI